MGTVVTVTLYDSDEKILDEVFDKVVEIENLVSVNKEGTEIDILNKNAGVKSVALSDSSFEIVKWAVKYSALSDGGYDLTIGPLVKLWNIGTDKAKVPTEYEINEAINLIDYKKVILNEDTKEVFLEDEGMSIDLGSIAKGYVADEITKILRENDIKKAIIDLGGNIFVLGQKSEDEDWTVGIQNPFESRGNAVGSLNVSNKAVVTSGIYERYLEQDSKKYHHILNPNTGYPYETEIVGVSIVADKSIDADALSTLAFTKGINEGIKLIESLDGVDAIFINEKKEVYITEGLEGNFKIIDDEFLLFK
jgi:thiamine biosynthesis lipoprotein